MSLLSPPPLTYTMLQHCNSIERLTYLKSEEATLLVRAALLQDPHPKKRYVNIADVISKNGVDASEARDVFRLDETHYRQTVNMWSTRNPIPREILDDLRKEIHFMDVAQVHDIPPDDFPDWREYIGPNDYADMVRRTEAKKELQVVYYRMMFANSI